MSAAKSQDKQPTSDVVMADSEEDYDDDDDHDIEDANDDGDAEDEEGWWEPYNYQTVKRPPMRPPLQPNQIYVSRKSKFIVLYKKALKLLDKDSTREIKLSGLGAAVRATIRLAITIQRKSGYKLQLAPQTDTVMLIDDFQPVNEAKEPFTQVRFNSAIHIRLIKIHPPAALT